MALDYRDLWYSGKLTKLAGECDTATKVAKKLGVTRDALTGALARLRKDDPNVPTMTELVSPVEDLLGGPRQVGTNAKQAPEDEKLLREVSAGGQSLIAFGTPIERVSAEALLQYGSVGKAAGMLRLEPRQLRAHLQELQRRAAVRGYAPGSDMTKSTPQGYSIKGVSTLYDGDGQVRQQWVKTRRDDDENIAALLDAMSEIAHKWQGVADPVKAPSSRALDSDLLSVYLAGDPHIGMLAIAAESGSDFDIKIAERDLTTAVNHLIEVSPRSKECLIVNLGDFFHADSAAAATTAGTRVDVDTRWSKVLGVGIRIMRHCIDQALTKHDAVNVINEIGNHDTSTSVMLGLCLAQYYEREPRVQIDTSPNKFHWFRFGKNLICTTHGDTVKIDQMPGVMASDRPKDWGETEYRYGYRGHVHHDSAKEFAGAIIETVRTLAPKDAWHAGQGYRSGQDMKCDVLHKEYGRVNRHTIGIRQVWSKQKKDKL